VVAPVALVLLLLISSELLMFEYCLTVLEIYTNLTG